MGNDNKSAGRGDGGRDLTRIVTDHEIGQGNRTSRTTPPTNDTYPIRPGNCDKNYYVNSGSEPIPEGTAFLGGVDPYNKYMSNKV